MYHQLEVRQVQIRPHGVRRVQGLLGVRLAPAQRSYVFPWLLSAEGRSLGSSVHSNVKRTRDLVVEYSTVSLRSDVSSHASALEVSYLRAAITQVVKFAMKAHSQHRVLEEILESGGIIRRTYEVCRPYWRSRADTWYK